MLTDERDIDAGSRKAEEMPSRVTVVVPTKNAERTLESCLRSLRYQSEACRVVVVDNYSTDATTLIAERWADVLIQAGPERSAQRNRGAAAAPAPVVGFIDADMVVGQRVVEEAAAAIQRGAGAVIVPESTVGEGFWASVRAFERSFYEGSDAVEAARFFRWEVFEGVGGFDESLTGPEDWDITASARQSLPVARISATIKHDEGRVRYLEACRKKAYYAEGLRRYAAKRGTSAIRQGASRPWMRRPLQLATPRGLGLLMLKGGELLAVAAALSKSSVGKLPQ